MCIPAILQIHVCFGTDTTDAVVSEERSCDLTKT